MIPKAFELILHTFLMISNIDQMNSNVNWECQTCGSLLDANGLVVMVEKS